MRLLILNFHGVGPVPRDMDAGERNCWLDTEMFENVLELVRRRDDVRLTVDDGNESDLQFIVPALKRRNLKATFFVCSGRLGKPTFLSAGQLRELLRLGMEIGSHGVDHVPWRGLPADRLQAEVRSSRAALQEACGTEIREAACPFGAYDRKVLRELRSAGYSAVYTSDAAMANPSRWLMPRITITRSRTLKQIERMLSQPPAWRQLADSMRIVVKSLRS